MNQTGQIILIAFLAAYLLFWGVIIYIGIPRQQREQNKQKYDERQIFAQGRAFKYAFLTLTVYLVAYGFLETVLGILWCTSLFGICLGIFFSLSVFFAYCVFQDAYFAIGESKPAALIAPNAIAFAQLLLGIESITEGTILDSGKITNDGLHFLFVALVLFLDVLILVKKRMDKKAV